MKLSNYIFILVISYSACFDHSQTVYCLSDDRCVTLCKKSGGVAHVVAGSSYGKNESEQSYVKTNTTQCLTFYFSNEMPDTIVVRDQGNIDDNSEFEIVNKKNGIQFVLFDRSIRNLLYEKDAKKFNDVKKEVDYVDLTIKENYAKNKAGHFIK